MKAILVFDVNEFTYEAINEYFTGDITLHIGNSGFIDFKDVALQPLPKKKKTKEINVIDDFMKSDIQIINEKVTAQMRLDTELLLASGYNLCIDEILGEE